MAIAECFVLDKTEDRFNRAVLRHTRNHHRAKGKRTALDSLIETHGDLFSPRLGGSDAGPLSY